jgi:hypothetical protein
MTVESSLQGLTGLFQALSGDVQDNTQIILGMPTKNDFDNLSATYSARFNTIEANITTINSKLDDIIGYMQNLKSSHVSLQATFTGHTGNTTDAHT